MKRSLYQASLRWVQRGLWGFAFFLGVLQTWAGLFSLDYTDGISYLDLSDAFRRGDLREALSPYWSPLYPGLLALGFGILRPSPYWEFPALHLINLGLYLLTLITFEYFLRELLRYYRRQFGDLAQNSPSPPTPVSEGKPSNLLQPHNSDLLAGHTTEILFRITAYTLFCYFSLAFLRVPLETPDMCVSAIVYLASGLLLRIHQGEQSPYPYLLLGLVLGLGYWAKAVMFVVGILLFLASLPAFVNKRGLTSSPFGEGTRGTPPQSRLFLSGLGVFLLLCATYILALSWATGQFTLGKSAQLNYLRYVNGVSWYGQSPRRLKGTLKHPPRRISHQLPIYEFGEAVGGTYPRWYNPAYWLEGLQPEIVLRDQLQALKRNAYRYYRILFSLQYEVLIGILLLGLLNPQPFTARQSLKSLGFLLLPALMVLVLYSLIIVEKRYIAPFLLILELSLIGIGSGAPLQGIRQRGSLLVLLWISLLLLGRCGTTLANDFYTRGQDPLAQGHWQIARELRKMGLQPGDKVACLGYGLKAYWARLARVQIVADMPTWNVNLFWALDNPSQQQVIQALRERGVRAIVAPSGPEEARSQGWAKVGATGYWVFFTSPSQKPETGKRRPQEP